MYPNKNLFDSDMGLLTHLGHLLFTLYIRTYMLSFGYVISRVFSFSSSTWCRSHNFSRRRHHHPASPLSFSICCLLPLRHTFLLIIVFSRRLRQASSSSSQEPLLGLYQQSMTSPTDSTFSPTSSALGSDTS